ncbi:MAG TPA: hypothetical protein VK892_15975 [Pyrinomonadaceae bacterium]|nr:hypothetical protein [Pyrinomonadaceae bacterium]
MSENVKESVRILLSEIIDYAGLFPPSKLLMPEAVINYAAYKNSNYNWMLGRFVVPVGRLDELLESAEEFVSRDVDGGWRLSVLAGEDIYETFRKIEDFNAKNSPKAVCDAIEIKVDSPSLIETVAEILPPNIKAYFEISPEGDLAEMISTLAINRQRAKIRTGGVTPEAFPPSKSIIRFVRTCMAANVPFKATAGLHHPVRCLKPLTYEADAPEGVMNGFLNLFLATGFARGGFKPNLLEELLEDESAENFRFDESGVHWREDFFLSNSQLKVVRERNIISFGSCSFEEPIEDLRHLGLL